MSANALTAPAASPLVFWRDVRARCPLLARAAVVFGALAAVFLVLTAVDPRTILGIDPWIKPLKFATSIALYLGTLGWMAGQLPAGLRGVRFITRGALVAMTIEMVCIAGQAARGTTSHFNNSTPFDGIVFGVMGLFIAFNSVLDAWLFVLFLRHPSSLSAPVRRGVQLGLVIFLLASVEGGVIVGHNSHSVGAPDGGPGLPLINWSTRVGDLRVAHFLGLHALQLLPLAGWFASRRLPPRVATRYVWGVALLLLVVFALTFVQAWSGHPLLATGVH